MDYGVCTAHTWTLSAVKENHVKMVLTLKLDRVQKEKKTSNNNSENSC